VFVLQNDEKDKMLTFYYFKNMKLALQ